MTIREYNLPKKPNANCQNYLLAWNILKFGTISTCKQSPKLNLSTVLTDITTNRLVSIPFPWDDY